MNHTPNRETLASLSQWQLIRLRFARHHLAVVSAYVLAVLYLLAAFADFVAPYPAALRRIEYAYCPPQVVRISLQDGLYTHPMVLRVDPVTFRKTYVEETTRRTRLHFLAQGEPYRLLGLLPARIRLLAPVAEDTGSPPTFFLFGADQYGRDLFSRIVLGARVSLSVGLVGIALTFLIGMGIGGVSGYVGGRTDTVIQRVIEIANAFPRLPLWLALGAAMPGDWSPLANYFAITLALSLLGWTGLARVVRGKILALREEDYALAARLMGAGHLRVLFRHLIPGFTSHIVVSLTLAVPGMILGETSLSFLGLGLRPPIVSWGVMLQDCMDIQAVHYYPWLMLPVLFLVLTVLCFNFLGDGMRDAADPYGTR